jgi:linoleoyl-CoA desaturase
MSTPKFPVVTPSFHSVLKQRVNQYFEEKGISPTGGWRLATKGILLGSLTVAAYLVVMLVQPGVLVSLLLCSLMGFLIATVGFNVMHDGSHGSFSKNPMVNKIAAFTLNILGGSAFMWNQKHNVIHHAYTNVQDVDDDLEAGILLRLSDHQPYLKVHRLQHIYFWVLYCLLYFFWIFFSDYQKYFRRKIGDIPLKEMSIRDHFEFWISKVVHAGLFIVWPIAIFGFWAWLLGFVVLAATSGLILSIVFQLAHTVEDASFMAPDPHTNKLEDEWAVHQLKTTANFATRSRIISWLVGGLNFQVEHHLFPRISHIHYPAINKIVKEACQEYKVPYLEFPTMGKAIKSHVRYLKRLGQAA